MTATPKVPATDLMSVEAARVLIDQIRDDAEMLWPRSWTPTPVGSGRSSVTSSWDTYCGTEFGNRCGYGCRKRSAVTWCARCASRG